MARPRSVGLSYFNVDIDFYHDPKIAAMRNLFGNDAIAFFVILLCEIYQAGDARLSIADSDIRNVMVAAVGVNSEKFEKMLALALKLGLFDAATYKRYKILTSESIWKRFRIATKHRESMRKSRASGVSDAQTGAQTPSQTPKEKKSKGNKSRAKKVIEVVIPEQLLALEGFADAWNRWLRYRSELHKPLTLSTQESHLEKLSQQPDPIACIKQSIDRGWMGLFELKGDGNGAIARSARRQIITKGDVLSVAEAARRINEGNLRRGQ